MSEEIRPEDILTVEELATRLKMRPSWVYEQTRRRGRKTKTPMPVMRPGKFLRFSWSAVCAWMRANKTDGG
jgi:predicted DNA-binding transcriptional regulator AlpA